MTGPHKISECLASQKNTKAFATLFSGYISKISLSSYFACFGQALPLPSKRIMPTCWNFDVYLDVKNQLHLWPFLLRYCKEIANFLFWELWECLNMAIKIIVSICSKLSCLSACKNQLHHTFFLRHWKEIANLLFSIIWACLVMTPKMIASIWRNLRRVFAGKKLTSSFTLFLRYCKDIVNLLFWVLWACLAMHTQSETINFYDYCMQKPNFIKNQNNLILGPFWGLFAQIRGKMNFPEKWALSAFKHFNYLPMCLKHEKTNEPFLRKMPNWRKDGQMDRQTDRHTANSDFIVVSVERRSNYTFLWLS